MDSYAGMTPPVLFVELYMREFAIPGDPEQIPRQGYQGSYVVIDLTLVDEKSPEPEIKDVCAIRVINGEERGMYAMSIEDAAKTNEEKSDRSFAGESSFPEAGPEKLVQGLQRFTGYLPIVLHDDSGKKKEALENSWGIYCGKPFSNLVVNIFEMAENHLYQLKDYSLESISDWLGIGAFCDNLQENRCRMIWCIYGKFG